MSASVTTVTVCEATLKQDFLLHIVLKTAAQRNLCFLQTKKKANLQLQAEGDVVLKQRNAVVRALAWNQAPYYWAGSQPAALTAWMSVAHQVKTNSDEDVAAALDQHLLQNAYLIEGTAVPTVADLDLAMALMYRSNNNSSGGEESSSALLGRNVSRWMRTTLAIWTDYAKAVQVPVPAKVDEVVASQPPPQPWWFGNGSEPVEDVLQGIHKPQGAAESSSNNNNKGKQQQNQKQQGKGKQQQKQQQQTKKDKQPKQQQQQQQQQQQAAADFDIHALDMRVGKIIKVWPHPEAEKLFCEEIDMGNGQVRQVASGLRPYYQDADLLNQKVLVLCNLKKRNLVGFPSHGMVLCATSSSDDGDNRKVELVLPHADTPLGERAIFEGIPEQEAVPENKVAKKKVFEKLAPDLKTNAEGQVVWKDAVAKVGGAVLSSVNGLKGAQVS